MSFSDSKKYSKKRKILEMPEEKEERELRFLTPVQQIPFGRRSRTSFYDDIIKEFIESNLKYVEVKELSRKPVTVALTLREKIKNRDIRNIKVLQRKDKVYLERTG